MNPEENHTENFPLDDAAIALIAQLREQIKVAQIAQEAILTYFARIHGLVGQCRLAENGRELLVRRTPEGVRQ